MTLPRCAGCFQETDQAQALDCEQLELKYGRIWIVPLRPSPIIYFFGSLFFYDLELTRGRGQQKAIPHNNLRPKLICVKKGEDTAGVTS